MDKKYFPTRITVVIAVALVIFLSGCAKQPAPMADDAGATPEKVSSVVNANNQFAFELYSKYKDDPKHENTNIFFSPYSISTALAMTYEGARGQTAEEMQSVLHFPENPDVRRPAFARIYNEINSKDKEYQLSTANALWTRKGWKLLEEYSNNVEKYYGGKVTDINFIAEPEKSRQTINKWVEEQTNNKIKNLIPQGFIDPDTRLVLTNAIYFKGIWVKQFDKKDTRDEDFTTTSGQTVKTPMMRLTGEKAKFNYAETEELQILEMPYEGEDLSMLVLLPKEDTLDKLEHSLDEEKLNEWRNMLQERKIDVYIPRFKFETKYFMAQSLEEMGMPIAFSMGADFSGMYGDDGLWVKDVIHQAFVEVNEEGTEAAAATAVIMIDSIGPITPMFRADHPFIFIIQQKDTGNILFLGKVMDPTK